MLEEGVAVGRVISSTDHHIEFLLFIIAEDTKLLNYIIFFLLLIVSKAVLKSVMLMLVTLYELGVLIAMVIVFVIEEVLNEVCTAVIPWLVK
jgi:hypothetical protein